MEQKNNKIQSKILMYHSVGVPIDEEAGAELYCVAEERFREQMKFVASSGTVPSPSGTSCGDSPFTVTFDDGDITNYMVAYPILKYLGLEAYFFIIVSKVGTKGYMDWEQIKEIRDAGMVIGSHGMTHRILIGLKEKELQFELRESKRIIEEKLKQKIYYFSIPKGGYNKKVLAEAKKAGYIAAFSSDPKNGHDFKIGRIPVRGNWDLEYFKKVISNGLPLKAKAGELIKSSSKKILGVNNYTKIRQKLLKK
ncbi:MAG: polysaccharide deacetylase family protein [Candidatus Omnitrophota bacterium]|nr:polysaccharide deacetylase family protein [Candidatus Omnitrophota bacterium]